MDFRDGRSVASGANSGNVLTGNAFEFAPRRPTAVMVYAIQDPPTVAGEEDLFLMDFLLGTTIVAQNAAVPALAFGTAAGSGPNRQDHLIASGVAAPGDRIVVSYRNGSANANRVRTLITFRPV